MRTRDTRREGYKDTRLKLWIIGVSLITCSRRHHATPLSPSPKTDLTSWHGRIIQFNKQGIYCRLLELNKAGESSELNIKLHLLSRDGQETRFPGHRHKETFSPTQKKKMEEKVVFNTWKWETTKLRIRSRDPS